MWSDSGKQQEAAARHSKEPSGHKSPSIYATRSNVTTLTRNDIFSFSPADTIKSPVLTCPQTLSFQLITVVFLVVLFFPFHMSDVMSCIFLFLIDCFSCKCAQTWFPSPQFSQFHFTSQYRSKINTCQVLNARKCTIIPLYAEQIHRWEIYLVTQQPELMRNNIFTNCLASLILYLMQL